MRSSSTCSPALPLSLDGPAWWDRYTGATNSLERVRERIEEDRRALALAGRTAVYLDLLDAQYRRAARSPLLPQRNWSACFRAALASMHRRRLRTILTTRSCAPRRC